MKMSHRPKVTVVTVVRNADHVLERTILSVLGQTYPSIEYIIVDGASTDGTLDIIRKYEKSIAGWTSGQDGGIYFAMNKGIALATGDWINFMNAGDEFLSERTLEQFMSAVEPGTDVAYGDTQLVLPFGDYIKKGHTDFNAKNTMPFVHQAAFARSALLKERPFDTTYRLCADRAWFYQMYQTGFSFQYLPVTVARYEAEEGVSTVNVDKLELEMARVAGVSGRMSWKAGFAVRRINRAVRNWMKRLLPSGLVTKIRRRKAEKNYRA
jgi:glycosyltransferase involved in cell wall biosynthesis